MKKAKILSLILACAMIAGLLAACGGGTTADTTPSASTAPTESAAPSESTGGTYDLKVSIASEPMTIDPALNSAVDGAIMTQHVFEGLMKWANSGTAADDKLDSAEVVPGQAASYEKTDNGDGTVTYTFTLRDDIKWSDGQPVTANDFVYSWQRLATPETAADYCYMIDMVKGYAEVNSGAADPTTLGVSAPDEKTFVVDLTYDCPYFLEICAFPATLPVRQDIIEQYGDEWTFSPDSYIGNGAYKMSEWKHNASITMVKNDQYYDYANLGPDSITFQLMDNANAMLSAYNADELQFINNAPVDEFASLLASGELTIGDYIGTYYVSYNVEQAPFDDWRVRKAFTLAIDSNYIVENVSQAGEIPANGFVPSGVYDAEGSTGEDFRTVGGAYWDSSKEAYEANLAEANKLLDEAGYSDRSTFPVVTYMYNTDDKHEAIAEALQNMWSTGLGVTVQLQNQDWSVFLENRKQGDYQVARNGWIADYNDPISFLDMWMTGGGNNDAQYSDADYDAAIARAKATSDPAERMAAMHEAEDILLERDWVLGPIYFYTQPYMLKSDVDGVYYSPLGYFFFQYSSRG